MDFSAKPGLGADAVEIADQQHPDHQLRIDGRLASSGLMASKSRRASTLRNRTIPLFAPNAATFSPVSTDSEKLSLQSYLQARNGRLWNLHRLRWRSLRYNTAMSETSFTVTYLLWTLCRRHLPLVSRHL